MVETGFGAPLVGLLSDSIAAHTHHESLREALVIVALLNIWSAAHFFMAARTLRADLARAKAAA